MQKKVIFNDEQINSSISSLIMETITNKNNQNTNISFSKSDFFLHEFEKTIRYQNYKKFLLKFIQMYLLHCFPTK